ncbi:MAG: arylsulfatase [Novosphingobium sp.]|nr:arylsulfatase [Novosphingobium sp.]
MLKGRLARMTVLASGALTLGMAATPLNAQQSTPTPQAEVPVPYAPGQRQEQRPNVLVWMLDDVGFAQLSCFGGLVATPNIDRVAAMGLRYSNYHTAPICSAARASLLSGRMPHSVNIGSHAAVARPFPGYNGQIPASAGSIADNLHQAGYATFALGKWDHLLAEESTLAGPFDQWPAGQGFDRFYGFLAADADNWNPTLIRDLSPVTKPDDPDYHLNDDLADQAISMIRSRDARNPSRPFFMYWATGTAHAPHHAPQEWIDRYKGKFDMGWDKAREAILKQQKAEGLVPEQTKLGPRPEGMPAWNRLSAEQKTLFARQMEVFAASLSHADEQFGRILDALEASGELENTIVVVTSDNGASAEGALNGLFSEALLGSGKQPSLAENMEFYDRWGGPETYPHYSFGWAVAGDTPFRYFKQTTHEGGTHVPLVVAWPKGIAARGERRAQFVHVADIAPTILDAAGVPLAETVNNVKQQPMEGISFTYSFAAPEAPTRKSAQYFEMFGNKGLWSDDWLLVTTHRTKPWDMTTATPPNEPWELYDLAKDPGETSDLAKRNPERVASMDRAFAEQAERYNVNPIGNVSEGTLETMRKAREEFSRRGGKWRFEGPVSNIPGTVAPPISALSFTMTAALDLPDNSVTGPVFANGGHLGGMGLYLRDGKPVVILTTIKGETTEIAAGEALPAGQSTLSLTFTNARGSDEHRVTISANDKTLAHDTVSFAMPVSFGIFESFGVGIDYGSALLPGAKAGVPFAGTIGEVVFDFSAPH